MRRHALGRVPSVEEVRVRALIFFVLSRCLRSFVSSKFGFVVAGVLENMRSMFSPGRDCEGKKNAAF